MSRHHSLPCVLAAVSLMVVSAVRAEPVSVERIEARAACITHEGADVPIRQDGKQPAPAKECAAALLDGTACGNSEGSERQCLAAEIALWDGVLDRLVKISDKKDRQVSLRGAIAAFRGFREKACATFQKVSINTPGPNALASCRVVESARFAQELYIHFYSP